MTRFVAGFFYFAALGAAAQFPHGLHIGMGLECVACHTAAPTSTKAEDNLLPSPDVCKTCHGDAAIGEPRKTLVAHFNHSIHVKQRTCAECHRGMDTTLLTGKENFPTMADCLSCHKEEHPPDSCYLCHDKSIKVPPKN